MGLYNNVDHVIMKKRFPDKKVMGVGKDRNYEAG